MHICFSKSIEWATPKNFFDVVQNEFDLEIYVCATKENCKLKKYWTKKENGLSQNWKGLKIWMNPPYGREIGTWIKKAATSQAKIVVALLPARTDTKWFHHYIYRKAEIRFIKGRLKLGNAKTSAPFPSMLVIFRHTTQTFKTK